MNNSELKYFMYRALSFFSFIFFYYILSNWEKYINKFLPYNIWEITLISILANIIFGVIIGWFLSDNIYFKPIKKLNNIALISILAIISIYPILYYLPLMGDSLSYSFLKICMYFQWALGVYLFLMIKDTIVSRKNREV